MARGGREGDWLGARVFSGFCLLLLLVYFGHLVLGLTLPVAAGVSAGMAGLGLTRLVLRGFGKDRSILVHPVVLMPLAGMVILVIRGLDYQPLAWDELTNWLAWTRQAALKGRLLGDDIRHGVLGYTPGWTIALAYPNLLFGGFIESRSAMVPFVMHVALCGLIHDIAMRLRLLLGVSRVSARLGAWVLVLGLLGVEAMWRLAPTNLLIEKPQIYTLTAALLLGLLILEDAADRMRAGLHLGLVIAGGYLIKVSMLAFVAPLLVLLGWAALRSAGQGRSRIAVMFGLALVPTILVYGVWRSVGAVQGCMSDPLALLPGLLAGGDGSVRMTDLFLRLFGTILAYVAEFKLPLTLVAAGGVAVAAFNARQRPLIIAFALYLLLYFGALYVYHLDCFGEFYFKNLNSPDRFTRVPLRTFHAAGLVLLFFALHPVEVRLHRWTLPILAAVLGVWGVYRLDMSIRSMTERFEAAGEQVTTVRTMRGWTEAVAARVLLHPEQGRDVQIIAQGSDGYEVMIMTYFAAGRFIVHGSHSFGEAPINVWMSKASPDTFRRRIMESSLVVPVHLDTWARQSLDIGAGCLDSPRLLVPDAVTGRMECPQEP
ncbi:hypothetical protein CCC_02180 [Paramagnetospirillum magnetotacticum MS-1]|uniref:Glycosyltransferase RgtA/B/C/D-like domain-containing protein n=1 Tax=Paramagnetospirillum magnetotacticum MS-1 TaxID=272627 RepID=A0A0C2YVJ9_PARME|nr:hypothetical protein CCC_02180 [Paramagnetospirillum magnetotacticum MS-1]